MARTAGDKVEKLLSLLDSAGKKEHLSGEVLAERAGVSRSAVWKQVRLLRKYGYGIESRPGSGYRLLHRTDLPLPWELDRLLKTKHVGTRIVYLENAESTQAKALSIAESSPDFGGLVVIAEQQSHGRGRMRRNWLSPRGGLWLSAIVRPRLPIENVTLIPLAAAIAVQQAIKQATGLEARLKWPNDVLIKGRKVAGILLDASVEADLVNYVVIGVGVNANLDAREIESKVSSGQPVTSISNELGTKVSRLELARLAIENLELYIGMLEKDSAGLVSVWKENSDMLGKHVTVLQEGKPIHHGTASDVGSDGSLLIRPHHGALIRVSSGDIQVRL